MEKNLMRYYQLLILKLNIPNLTYHSFDNLKIGSIVKIPLKTMTKEAIIIDEVSKPSFKTLEILSIKDSFYTQEQIDIANFISKYYFSSLRDAISLFSPYKISSPKIIINQIYKRPILSASQQKAYNEIIQKDKSLLFGVTGSGKTEIFISLIIEMLEKNRTSIFLMPEISLTPQMEKRLKLYFGDIVAMWHSKLTKKKKESILQDISEGKISIIAGARSALFVPISNLGLIIVDEEHDDSYKSNSRPRYNARDMAIFIGDKLNAKVLLASATPSITSYYKYAVVKLEKPFRETKKSYYFISGDSITSDILNSLKDNNRAEEQSIMFIPTRGNFKYLYCPKCGKTHLCPHCSVGIALHRKYRHLKCHYCNFTEAIRESCKECGYAPLSSKRMGTVEAIEIINEAIEDIKIEQFDRDSITTPTKLKQALKRFESGKTNLLLGTQMLSKGHDYANITLCIIMGLDYILGMADYRARQKALSLFFQIAGRSGRAKEATVIIQTSNREFFESYLNDYELFMKDELKFLKIAHYPPFASLARVLISDKEQSKAGKITLETVTKLKTFLDIEIVGQGKAPIEKIANKFRFHILLRAKNRVPLLKALKSVNCKEIEIDFDPIEFS